MFDEYRIAHGADSDVDGCIRFLEERFSSQESCALVAVREETIIGFAHLYPRFASLKLSRNWILNDLYVCPEERRKGIARDLIEESKAFARDLGADMLTVTTTEENMAAKALYLSAGFKTIAGLEIFGCSVKAP